MIHENIIELIGRTPLRLNRFAANRNLKADIVAKVEYFNPGGSVNDRLALAMMQMNRREFLKRAALSSSRLGQYRHRTLDGGSHKGYK